MSQNHNDPLISDVSAMYLVSVINRVAASFNVATLSSSEAVAVYILLDRLTDSLRQEHEQVILDLHEKLLSHLTTVDVTDSDDPANENEDQGEDDDDSP